MASLLFKTTMTTRMHDIDAAGVVFFARIFYFAHDAYEAFLDHHQQSINHILNSDWLLPITQVTADFKAPIYLNERLDIELYSQDVGDDEFSLRYHFVDQSGAIRATAVSQHVCLERQSRRRKTLPDSLLAILK